METESQKHHSEPSTALKVAVLIGLITLLIVGILLPIKLVPHALSTIGTDLSNFFGAHQRIILTTNPSSIVSGKPFTLSWNGPQQVNGTYIISYSCVDGVHFETSTNQPNEAINCNTQYYFSSPNNSIVLTPYSLMQTVAAVTIHLSFLENGASAPQALSDINIAILNLTPTPTTTATSTVTTNVVTPQPALATPPHLSSPVSTVTQPAPQSQTQPVTTHSTQYSNPQGTADLAVTITSVGYIDPTTQQFVPSQSAGSDDRVAVKFNISNVGTKNTGLWNFVAELPSQSEPSYSSAIQQNLGPGDHIAYTLSFDQLNPSPSNVITITADPNNSIPEISEANNTASITILNSNPNPYSYTSGSSYNNYGYGNGTNYGIGPSDLSVTIISTGRISATTGQFYQTSEYSNQNYQDQPAVQFTVQNLGQYPTGQWRYVANLPNQAPQYVSPYQPSLNPGESRTLTANFSYYPASYMGSQTISITVDPYHETSDVNPGNNTATTQVN